MENKFKNETSFLLRNKKVLIFGLGLNQGGVGAAQFFAKLGAVVKVTDLKTEEVLKSSLEQLKEFKNITYTLGEHKYEDFDWADIIIRNPAIKDNNPYLKYALEKGKRIETDFSIFLELADQKKIIAITGTKGKSTTASLIYETISLSYLGGAILAGNIGKSILDTLPYLKENPWIVAEISSFQLQALKGKNFAPKIAVITNIYPDHLNWHSSMEEYILAKKMIAINQSKDDFLVLPCHDSKHIPNAKSLLDGIKSQTITCCIEDYRDQYESIDLPLKGFANWENYSLAICVAEILGIDNKITLNAFQKFKGGEFRMQNLGKFNGVSIINDSTATNPIASIAALETLGNHKIILITGGMNKGMDYAKFAQMIKQYAKKVFFLEGDATDSILASFRAERSNLPIYGPYNDLGTLLQDVKKVTKPGDVVLFSPASTSFNLFQNEFDRGRKFNEAVQKVFKNKNA